MIAGIVVLYHFDREKILANIHSYLPTLDRLFVIDNSDTDNSALFTEEKMEYVPLMENKGIAYALKLGMKKIAEGSYDYALTMDQDSHFEDGVFEEYMAIVRANENKNIGIFGPNYLGKEEGLEAVKYLITSGAVINVRAYEETNGFREDLFIDFVDYDLCYQLAEKGYSVVQVKNIHLVHTLGENKKKKFLGKSFLVYNHSPLRMYYSYRNYYYCTHLTKERKKYFRKLKRNYYLTDIIKLYLFEDEKMKKRKMIRKGIKDAKAGKLGIYAEKNKKRAVL